MDVKIIASTHISHEGEKGRFDDFSGKMVGLTNTPDNLKTLMFEDNAKAQRRSESAKIENNREYFNHESFTLYFEGLPKIISIIIDSGKTWVKSEKASRFNESYFSKDEELIYNKWIDLFKNKISKLYKDKGEVCTDKMLENMSVEYAVYLKSVFSPVTCAYTVTYGEFNRLIGVIENYIGIEKTNDFENKLSAALIEFVLKLKTLPYYDKSLAKVKDNIWLFTSNNIEEYYGDVYATSYKCSYECLSQLLQYKDIDTKASMLENEYYIPSIIADNKDLSELWVSDIMTLGNYPMASMLSINEMGTLDNFMHKLSDSVDNSIATEVGDAINETYKKYEYSLRLKMHARAEELIKLNK